MNAELAGRPYVLIGVGRWGSADPWLGIPVTWEQISGARVIVEAGFTDFTINPDAGDSFVAWDYLAAAPTVRETAYIRHLWFDQPAVVKMNGKLGEGIILKP